MDLIYSPAQGMLTEVESVRVLEGRRDLSGGDSKLPGSDGVIGFLIKLDHHHHGSYVTQVPSMIFKTSMGQS